MRPIFLQISIVFFFISIAIIVYLINEQHKLKGQLLVAKKVQSALAAPNNYNLL